jgi:hypothetical protein
LLLLTARSSDSRQAWLALVTLRHIGAIDAASFVTDLV